MKSRSFYALILIVIFWSLLLNAVAEDLSVDVIPDKSVADGGEIITWRIQPKGGVAPYTIHVEGFEIIVDGIWQSPYGNNEIIKKTNGEPEYVSCQVLYNGEMWVHLTVTDSTGNWVDGLELKANQEPVIVKNAIEPLHCTITADKDEAKIGETITWKFDIYPYEKAEYFCNLSIITNSNNERIFKNDTMYLKKDNNSYEYKIKDEGELSCLFTITDTDREENDIKWVEWVFESSMVKVEGTVEKVLTGDCTNDDIVDGRDLLRLARYIAGTGVEIDEKAADINGDGNVDGRDVLRLAKQLAGS